MATPEKLKGLIEDGEIVFLANKQATRRVVEIRLVPNFNVLQRPDQRDNPAGVDIHTQGSKQPPKEQKIVQEVAVI